MSVVQTLDARYIDGEKLLRLLLSLFGSRNFTVEHANDNYTLTTPRSLTTAHSNGILMDDGGPLPYSSSSSTISKHGPASVGNAEPLLNLDECYFPGPFQDMNGDNFPADWRPYIDSVSSKSYDHVDLLDKCLQLDSEAPRIFSGNDEMKVWTRDAEGKRTTSSINDTLSSSADVVYIIHQRHSWSPLDTSLSEYQRLLVSHGVSPVFIDAIQAFGSKVTGEDDPYFNLHSLRASEKGAGYEVCYILRTYERHGRQNLQDPWSLRQMSVYHQFDSTNNRSVWILVQPFARSKSVFLSRCFDATLRQTPEMLHSVFIHGALASWRWYLDDRRRLINGYREKAEFSHVGPKQKDYPSEFTDCKKLNQVASSLLLGKEILTSYEQVVLMLRSQHLVQKGIMLEHIRCIRARARAASVLREMAEKTSGLRVAVELAGIQEIGCLDRPGPGFGGFDTGLQFSDPANEEYGPSVTNRDAVNQDYDIYCHAVFTSNSYCFAVLLGPGSDSKKNI
ncbi:Uu.00g098990.m01.CDS01 [Anthostomella pinea]|uniref:Uu.00g098990.m01.CDS01 n=1 Tax=Anthostomella pinea TaxID=933095 RepID=A0AAI8VCN5_9PEZI|nr:Uu.00g098990.m01.CDS01 [Anthostomella pinea]